ncbi:sialidase family protein [Microbulbifer pacificus]|uniref:Sialidase family protein n=1 Tax=Microbulbifer pacificus TaxID=407164 RepID=A0AAU0MV71_9GAMM|nr:sialidase family protein [Microbulbifer pacificus]WOX04521.1 sialidase family protein [Microbulbifer pacificus]
MIFTVASTPSTRAKKWLRACLLPVILSTSFDASAQPFSVVEGLFNGAMPETMGLRFPVAVEHTTVFRGEQGKSQYNHGAVLYGFGDKLYLQWQSSARDEDAADTSVLYASSRDGLHWSEPRILEKARDNAVVTSGGWWSAGNTLYAFINVWPNDLQPRGGHVEVLASSDGIHWKNMGRPTFADGRPLNGVIEQDFHRYHGGRIVTALHRQPGLRATPIYTDDPSALSGWKPGEFANLSVENDVSRELEPSSFQRADGALVMVFRDQQSSFHVLASVSKDNGATWSQAEWTNLPDSRAKQSAGNLPDGSAYLVNNPSSSKSREPLAISLSRDGKTFDRAFLLRAGGNQLADPRYEGLYKRKGFSYPKSFVWKDNLYVAYGENKEDIVVTRIPLTSLMAD